jgi:uncharacterized protein (DUF488 family)
VRLWTIGHSTHAFDAFVALLSAHEVELVADIRTVPKSRRHPQFHTASLAASLPGRDIAYTHLAALGGWRQAAPDSPNDGWQNRSFRGYADYAMSEAFAAGLAELRGLAAERRTAMMCSEALWWRCHRRLVADQLVVRGDTVCHIDAAGRARRHALTAFAVVEPDGAVTYPARVS